MRDLCNNFSYEFLSTVYMVGLIKCKCKSWECPHINDGTGKLTIKVV